MTSSKGSDARGDDPSSPGASKESLDTGLALVLICLLGAWWWETLRPLPAAAGLLLACMTVPGIFRPLAGLWLGFSRLTGAVASRIVLSLVFFLLVTPVGLARRLLGRDPMQLRRWKKDDGSVFASRSGVVARKDMEKPF